MKKYLQLILGCFLIWLFIWQIVPWLTRRTAYGQMEQFIQERSIDSGSLFYTESPEAGEAGFYFQKKQPANKQKLLHEQQGD